MCVCAEREIEIARERVCEREMDRVIERGTEREERKRLRAEKVIFSCNNLKSMLYICSNVYIFRHVLIL